MSSLTIAWVYLAGYAVATDPTSRERAEWPPHPARVFMALAAAWFETEPADADANARSDWTAEGAALRWLETLGDPEMNLPTVDSQSERSSATVFVPVNDKAGPASATLQSCPAMTRSKQPRSFPRIWIGAQTCAVHWAYADHVTEHHEALERLCRKVTRLGHSSSLVSMYIAHEPVRQERNLLPCDDGLAHERVRSISNGMLKMLEEKYGEPARRRHLELTGEVDALRADRRNVAGKGARERRAAIDEQIQKIEAERSAISLRSPVRPTVGLWTGYRQDSGDGASSWSARSMFDHDLFILVHVGGPTLTLLSTLAVTRTLRATIMSGVRQPVPQWVCGHGPDGDALRDGQGHVALLPLPSLGHEYSDGHLLGVAIAFPRSISPSERGRALDSVLVGASGEAKDIPLKLGKLGLWQVCKRDWQERRAALQSSQWTAGQTGAEGSWGARIWASVTPVVLDRYPKAPRRGPVERQAWEAEVRGIISESCVRIGLPEPDLIDVDTTSWHLGSPRSVGKRRPLRGLSREDDAEDAALGDGFPPYPAKGTNAPRPQVHAWLQFPCPVVGPVILGAGRYYGYGLCKPLARRKP